MVNVSCYMFTDVVWSISNASFSGGGTGYSGSKTCISGSYCMIYSDCGWFACRSDRA